jgi:hypothetical protein
MKKPIVYLFACLALFSACEKDPEKNEESCNDCQNDTYLYVSNEGPFGGTGSISKINVTKRTVDNDVYSSANNEIPIGSIVQSLAVHNNIGFAVLNAGNKITTFNKSTNEHLSSFSVAYPRYIAVNGDYGYVTSGNYEGKVYKFNLITNTIIDSVEVGNGPEQLIVTNNKIIVTNSGGWSNDSTIAIIDLESFKLDSLIEVGSKPTDILEDKNGFIWVLASGKYENTKAPKLVQINTMNWSIEKDLILGSDDESVSKITIDKTQENILFYKSDGVYKLNINESSAPSDAFVSASNCYGIEANSDVFLFVAPDFSSAGYVKQYSMKGDSIAQYNVGIAPNGGVFN